MNSKLLKYLETWATNIPSMGSFMNKNFNILYDIFNDLFKSCIFWQFIANSFSLIYFYIFFHIFEQLICKVIFIFWCTFLAGYASIRWVNILENFFILKAFRFFNVIIFGNVYNLKTTDWWNAEIFYDQWKNEENYS